MKAPVVIILTLFIAVSSSGQILSPVLNHAFLAVRGWFQTTTRCSALVLPQSGASGVFQRFGLSERLRFAGIAYLMSPGKKSKRSILFF